MSVFPEKRLSIITLGVNDREAMTRFYEDIIGFKNVGPEGMAMFDMGGFILGLWEEDKLAEDAGLPNDRSGSFRGAALAYNARSIEETDAVFERLETAGVTITKPPHKAFWGGYSGYFTDPEGNAWEVAYNPYWSIGEDGSVVMSSTEGA